MLQLSSLLIRPNRQRKEFDPVKLLELADSIRENGLLHPPVVRMEDGHPVLVAGERRLRAMKDIFALGGSIRYGEVICPPGMIPVNLVGELDPLAAEEAELDENLRRENLTWQEHAAAVDRLMKLRLAQRERVIQENPDTPPPAAPTPQSLAKELYENAGDGSGWYGTQVRNDLIVAQHLADPEIAKAKSSKEAMKILQAREEREKNIQLAARVGATYTSAAHTVLNVDCIEWMKSYTGPGFDVICTDPPYGMGADQFGDAAGKLVVAKHHYDDSFERFVALMEEWCKLAYAVAAEESHAYVFCDVDNFHMLKGWMRQAGWYVFRTPLIAYKLNSGRVPLPEHGPRRQYETCLYAIKGNKKVTAIYPDVIPVPADANMAFGAQKPVELFHNLLLRSVQPGARVLDSFAGSGPCIAAGHMLKCYVTALELDPGQYGMCLKRLQALDVKNPLEGLV